MAFASYALHRDGVQVCNDDEEAIASLRVNEGEEEETGVAVEVLESEQIGRRVVFDQIDDGSIPALICQRSLE